MATSKQNKKRAVPVALSSEALLAKSRIHVKRAIEAKQAGDNEEFQLRATLALELLAKSSLAAIHPSLIVEPENANSMLEANGISTGTVIRTIKMHEVYTRLRHTVPQFGTPASEDCRKLSDRRNAELHSGEAAMAAVPPSVWEGPFWNAAELILNSIDMDLDDWLGVDAKTPKEILRVMRAAKKDAAIERIKHASEVFKKDADGKKRGKKEMDELRKCSKLVRPLEHYRDFRYLLDGHWRHECPACECMGTVGGDKVHEATAIDQSGIEYGYELVERTYSPVEFLCETCGLSLVGDEALAAGDLNDEHTEFDEREIDYEPDYGNE